MLVEAIEPRILHSADVSPLQLLDNGSDAVAEIRYLGSDGEFLEGIETLQQQQSRTVVFVDTDTPDYQQLIDQIVLESDQPDEIDVVLIEPETNGIDQISAFLFDRSDVSSVHIISHGSDASVNLGQGVLNADFLSENAGQISQWGDALTAEADLLIYGCDVAASDDGRALMDALARLTGADVAASDDLTGHAQLGGDWELEYRTGVIEAEMVLDEGFMVLDPSPLTGKRMGFIGVSEKGYTTLVITAHATGGHSSMPPRNSAAVNLSRAIIALDENQMPADFSKPPISDLLEASSRDMPFMNRMAFANLWLFKGMVDSSFSKIPAGNAMIRTTTAPTMLAGSAKENVLPQRAMATVNFRIHPNDTPESVMQHVKDLTSDIEGIEVSLGEGGISSPASPVSPTDNRAYAVLASVAEKVGDGAPAAPSLVLGATDARYASAISKNVYRFAPALVKEEDTHGFHGTNERLEVANMKRLSEGYAQIILGMDGPDE